MIKNNLPELMLKRNINNKQLAELIGISYPQLVRLKKGRTKGIDFELMNNIYKVMELKPSDLIFQYVPE